MFTLGFNYFTVIGAALGGFILDTVWFSPWLFEHLNKKLSAGTGTPAQATEKVDWRPHVGHFLGLAVKAYVLALLMEIADAHTVLSGLQIGFIVWLGFEATTMAGAVLWEKKPVRWYFLHAGHHLLTILLMSALVALYR